jgi:hypothetical protein
MSISDPSSDHESTSHYPAEMIEILFLIWPLKLVYELTIGDNATNTKQGKTRCQI